jgi:D-3-phosphoglycerate dehydrogenase / 2-oxoglutarate reductase
MLARYINRKGFHTTANSLAKIMATDKVDPLCVEIFKKRGHEVDLVPTMSEADLIKAIPAYDGLVVRSATKVTPKVLHAARKMRIVGRAGNISTSADIVALNSHFSPGVGVDNIDVSEATKCGIMVMNTPDGNTVSTAQLAVSLMCNMARKIPSANTAVKQGN